MEINKNWYIKYPNIKSETYIISDYMIYMPIDYDELVEAHKKMKNHPAHKIMVELESYIKKFKDGFVEYNVKLRNLEKRLKNQKD